MDSSEPSDAHGRSARTPCWRTQTTIPVSEDFVPLRLAMQPSGATVELTQPDVLLGRHSHADIRLPLPDVSRRHCRFLFSQGVWQVVDLNSLNGVFLNDQLIRQASVRQGDILRIGGFTFVVELGTTAADSPNDSAGLIRSILKARPAPANDPEQHRLAS